MYSNAKQVLCERTGSDRTLINAKRADAEEICMHFELTKEQKDIQKAASEFAKKEFPAVCKECDREEKYPYELWKKACSLDFVGSFIKEEFGGAGLGYFENCLITEEFWKVDPGCGCILLS